MTESIYLAGPIQHVSDYGKGWREWLKNNHDEFEWVDPMDKYDTTDDVGQEWTNSDVVEDDLRMIDESDGLLAHWDTVPTAGTPMEIFYARRTAGGPVVIQTTLHEDDISPWVEYHADAIVETFEEAVDEFEEMFDRMPAAMLE